jgi:glycosyltransferase involved in cell wall biosynthesis
MDEVWVPTLASRDAFVAGGVPLSKLVVVPEPVDTDFYRPQPRNQKHELVKVLSDWQVSPIVPKVTEGTFIFLFVGKFEYRKGIHILLRAYYEAFFSHLSEAHEIEDVLLCILTSAYHSTDDFNSEVKRFLKEENLIQSVPLDVFLSKIILYTDVPQIKMPVLYSMANVLVSENCNPYIAKKAFHCIFSKILSCNIF